MVICTNVQATDSVRGVFLLPEALVPDRSETQQHKVIYLSADCKGSMPKELFL